MDWQFKRKNILQIFHLELIFCGQIIFSLNHNWLLYLKTVAMFFFTFLYSNIKYQPLTKFSEYNFLLNETYIRINKNCLSPVILFLLRRQILINLHIKNNINASPSRWLKCGIVASKIHPLVKANACICNFRAYLFYGFLA